MQFQQIYVPLPRRWHGLQDSGNMFGDAIARQFSEAIGNGIEQKATGASRPERSEYI